MLGRQTPVSQPTPSEAALFARVASQVAPLEASNETTATTLTNEGDVAFHAPSRSDWIRSAGYVANRAARLGCDAVIILLFSPVIAIWWLLERRHRR